MSIKNAFKKENMMPVVTLTAICLVIAILLGGVNMLTKDKIAQQKADAANAALKVVLPDAKSFENITDTLTDDYPAEITAAYRADIGYVFETEVRGKEKMTVMCGIDADGKVVGVEVVSESETPDYKQKVFPLVLGTDGAYSGMDADTLEPELVSNATLTSRGIYNAVEASLNAYAVITGGEIIGGEDSEQTLPRTDAEILALAEAIVGEGAQLTAVPTSDTEYVKRLYKDAGGKGYVAYVLVISEQYGTVESETLVYAGNNGKIKAVDKLTWKTSDAIYGYVPPSEATVNAFYDRLPGKDSSNIGDVDLVANATNTSTSVVNSVSEALEVIDVLRLQDMPTAEEEVITLAEQLMASDAELVDVTPDDTVYVRRVYKDENRNGYVAYAVVISSSYGTVETETLIHVGNDGKIKGINKLTWKTSDAIYGYEPPSEATVNAFYDRLPGKDSSNIGEVDLVTNATNTSTNLITAISESLDAIDTLRMQDMPTAEAEVISLSKGLSGSATLTDVTPKGTEYVKRLYKDAGGKGYVAYLVVISSSYGTVETETLLHIDADGNIKDVKKLTWKTSDAINGYEPPSVETVNAFYDRLVGKNSKNIDSVELVANATNTSTRMVNSISEALEIIDSLKEPDYTARVVGIVILALAIASSVAVVIVFKKRRSSK